MVKLFKAILSFLMSLEIHYVTIFFLISVILCITGVIGLVFNRNNIIIIVLSIELLLLSINLNFAIFCLYLSLHGFIFAIVDQFFILFILVVAATELTIGLAIIVVYYRIKNTVYIKT